MTVARRIGRRAFLGAAILALGSARALWRSSRIDAGRVMPGATGVRLTRQISVAVVAASLLAEHQEVDVPVHVVRPATDSDRLDELGNHQRLAIGASGYAGSTKAVFR